MNTCCNLKKTRPSWLKKKIISGEKYKALHHQILKKGLNTVCTEACCPNQAECYSNGTATFLILGDKCTRNCRFCAVAHGLPGLPDPEEPETVARAVKQMGLFYAVVTSVTRDDLYDGGAGHFSAVIRQVKRLNDKTRIEVLVPDFNGNEKSIETILKAMPDVFNHNIETVPRLYPEVRNQADYTRSLSLFARVKQIDSHMITKSGIMLGLGEKETEIEQSLQDLYLSGCDILTIGQYLAPSDKHYPIRQYVTPDEFKKWEKTAIKIGFSAVTAGPFVRSSYQAVETFNKAKANLKHPISATP